MAAIVALWVPALIFAHVWAALFLWQLIKVARPQLARRLSLPCPVPAIRRLLHGWPRAWRTPTSEKGGDQKPAVVTEDQDISFGALQIAVPKDPVQPVALSWSGLSCSYTTHEGSKTVLQDVSGSVAAGEMVALLGPSGAGKSTLLDMLAGRKSTGTLSGTVYINGRPRTKAAQRNTAYMPQESLFVPSMTVEETCCYYAALTLPPGTSKQQRAARITSVLEEMGLSHVSSTLVGGMLPGGLSLRGLSGGERKRLAIATGLLAGPSLLFLDEPTSGLDSYAAWSVMCTLCALAHDTGHTVVASVHQPRATIWNLFDQVVLLSKGLLLYSGPRSGLVPWFQGLGYAYDSDVHGLPCDWVMDLVNVDFQSKSTASTGTAEGYSSKPQLGQMEVLNGQQGLEQAAQQFQQHQQQLLGMRKDTGVLLDSSCKAGALRTSKTDCCSVDQAGGDPGHASATGIIRLVVLETPSDDVSSKSADTMDSLHTGGMTSSASDTFSTNISAASNLAGLSSASCFCSNSSNISSSSSNSSSNSAGGAAAGAEPAARPRTGWCQQVRTLMWRESLSIARNPSDAAGRVLVFAYVAFAFGGLYYSLGTSLDALRMRLNLMYLITLTLLLKPYSHMALYLADKQYFIADTSAGLVSPSAYYVAKQLLMVPLQLVGVVIVTCIYYGMAGLRHSASAFFTTLAVNSLVHLIASQVMAAAATFTTSQDAAFMVSVVWSTFNMMLGNFLVRYQDMTWQWMAGLRWLIVEGFALDILETTELKHVEYPCTAGSLDGGSVSMLEGLFPRSSVFKGGLIKQYFLKNLDNCVLNAGALAEYYRGFSSIQLCFGYLVGYLALVHAISYLGLLRAAKREAR